MDASPRQRRSARSRTSTGKDSHLELDRAQEGPRAAGPFTQGGDMGAPVVHFEIHGKDGPGLAQFYEQLFDWKVEGAQMPNGYYGMVAGGEGGIGGGIAANEEGSKV